MAANCPICCGLLRQCVALIPCGHAFCKACVYPSRNATHILFHEILVGRFAKMIHCIEGKALFETCSTLAECGRLRCFFLNVCQLASCSPTQIQQSLVINHGRGSLSSINKYNYISLNFLAELRTENKSQ